MIIGCPECCCSCNLAAAADAEDMLEFIRSSRAKGQAAELLKAIATAVLRN